MSSKYVGWCRLTNELVFDKFILNQPYLRDDMEVYRLKNGFWDLWSPEQQGYAITREEAVPDVVKLAMVMLE